MNHKRKRAKNQRAGCFCKNKPRKMNGAGPKWEKPSERAIIADMDYEIATIVPSGWPEELDVVTTRVRCK